jgi:sulfate adenylyltransferase
VNQQIKRNLPEADSKSILRKISARNTLEPGLTVFFTGLSGAGKSTISSNLLPRLQNDSLRPVTLLDGDVVRKILSSELGYSREHRDLNILRIGYVASEITKHGGIAICSVIAPYEATRRKVREMVSQYGRFIEVYVATPMCICEKRDPKGLYAKARDGLLPGFTGISDPYEIPSAPELLIDTQDLSVSQCSDIILGYLKLEGFIRT